MPITLRAISRRQFLSGVGAGAVAALGAGARAPAADGARAPDPHRVALLSDVHIHSDKGQRTGEVVMWENMAKAVGEIVAMEPPASAAVINGDCAHFYGRAEDYATLIEAVAPLRRAGMAVHMTMGNHDDRGNFLKALAPRDNGRVEDRDVAEKYVCVVPMPRANLFLLDSLDRVNTLAGVMGAKQLAWLARALDARADKPAILFVHHNPDGRAKDKRAGLMETEELFEVLLPRKQVKALFYGHSHCWNSTKREGMHLVNLPPTAWLFMPALPRGWVDLRLREKGAVMELRSLEATHHLHGEKVEMAWR